MQNILDIIKISRPGFWPTHLWFYVLPFGQTNMFGSINFWLGCFYVCFPLSLLLYGWNDIGDAETDQDNQRKDSWLFGARPAATTRLQLPWIIALVQLPFILLFWWMAGGKMLALLFGIVLANYCYNNLNFKSIAGLDLLNQVGYLLIFVLASWLCDVPQLSLPAMMFGALFAMHSHLFGQLMDIDEDKKAGRRSTAIVAGNRNSKLLLTAIIFAEATIAFAWFNGPYVGLFMLSAALFFLVDTFLGPKKYPLWFVRWFFIGWNIVIAATIHFIWKYGFFILSEPAISH